MVVHRTAVLGTPEAEKLLKSTLPAPRRTVMRTFAKAPYERFVAAADQLGMDTRALCREIGYSDHAYHSWAEEGEYPKVADTAVQALLENQKLQLELSRLRSAAPQILLVSPTAEQQAMVLGFLDATHVKYTQVRA